MQDKRIWWSAIYFSMYDAVGTDWKESFADLGNEFLGALLE